VDYIYVLENRNLVGVFSIKELFRLSPSTRVEKIMLTKVVMASPKSEGEHIAQLAINHGIKSVPIVESKRFLGVIPPSKVSKLINHSLRKDIFHFAGIHKSHLKYENTLDAPLQESVLHRTPWIIIGLIGIMITAGLITLFESVLERNIILVFFMPAIAYLSAALGNQIQTIFIRDMTVMGENLQIHRYAVKQLSISSIIAVVVGILMFFSILIFWKESYVAWAISIATAVTLITSSITALAITYILKKSGRDPAVGGGPLGTVISDGTSIVIYLLIASSML
jgi:magnesium transporter